MQDSTHSYGDLERRAAARNIPLNAHLDLTYHCNLRCIHCYAVTDENRQELTTTEIKSILEQLADAGSLYLVLSGGEALLRPDYFEIAQYARQLGFALRLMTNGTLITPARAESIAELNPLFVEISLYGVSAKIHDAITGIPGSFDLTMAAIQRLSRFKLNLHIKTVTMRQNISELQAVKEFTESIGAFFRPDAVISPKINEDKSPVLNRISDRDLAWFYTEIKPEWIMHCPELNQPVCNAGKASVVISAFGDVFPCIRIQQKAGNLRRQSFQEIWNQSLTLKNIRELTLKKLKACAVCPDIAYCATCPGLAFMEHGTLFEPATENCRHAKIRKQAFNLIRR